MENLIQFPKLGLEFSINPTAFSIGPIHVAWYGLLITVGLALAIWYCFSNLKKFGLSEDRVIDVVIGGIIGGVIGGRLYYVAFSWEDYKYYLWDILKVWEGGMAIYGAIIGALIVGILVCKWRHVKVMPMLDIAGMGFLIGQCIGRWGNFVNAEAFGSNTNLPWGMTGPSIQAYLSSHAGALSSIGVTVDPTMPVHPCFLYESLWCLIGFIALHFYSKHRKFDGEMFLMYVGWYGLGRTVIEGLRTDSLMIGSLRISQVLAAVCTIVSVILILVIRSKIKNANDPEYMPLYTTTEESKMMVEGTYDAFEKEEKVRKAEEKAKKAAAKAAQTEETTAEEQSLTEDGLVLEEANEKSQETNTTQSESEETSKEDQQ